jgi:hypothetical protein
MAEYFYEDQWCHCNCFDLRWNMCNWFCFCHPFQVLLIVTCVYPYLRSIKFGIWGWFSQKGFYNEVHLPQTSHYFVPIWNCMLSCVVFKYTLYLCTPFYH